jgi:Na+-driven multidrug efflux pump
MSRILDLEQKIADITEAQLKSAQYDPKKHKDETRSTIALFVVKSYFYLMGLILIGTPLYNLFVKDPALYLSVKDIISVLAASTSGIFGFVVGYYFKGTESE